MHGSYSYGSAIYDGSVLSSITVVTEAPLRYLIKPDIITVDPGATTWNTATKRASDIHSIMYNQYWVHIVCIPLCSNIINDNIIKNIKVI